MKNSTLLICILVVLAVILGSLTLLKKEETEPQPVETVQSPPPEPVRLPIVHYPVPETEASPAQADSAQPEETQAVQPPAPEEKLPQVQQSDETIGQALKGLIPDAQLLKVLRMDNFVQRLVSTIDRLPEKRLPRQNLPAYPPEGKFRVDEDKQGQLFISPANAERYAAYMKILKYTPEDLVLKAYVHFYPLFQEAYRQLGYQNAYFNDRLVFVLDHLIQTPDPEEPIAVEQPVVLYTYKDPYLENLSAGQKCLLRMGRAQRLEAVEILRRYRLKLTNLAP